MRSLAATAGERCPAIRPPRGAKGKIKTDFMWPDDAFAIVAEADKIDPEFGLYLRLLIYIGIRKSEGIAGLPQGLAATFLPPL